jgi:hypothetical protein
LQLPFLKAPYLYPVLNKNASLIRVFLLLLLLPGIGSCLSAQTIFVKFQPAKGMYTPSSYYIRSVVDDRDDEAGIGSITNRNTKQVLALPNGTAPGIEHFLNSNLRWARNAQALELHIVKLEAGFKKKGAMWKWDGVATFAFYVEDRKLGEFTSKSKGETNTEPAVQAESFLRKNLEANLKQFEKWWVQNKDKIPTVSTVKVNVTVGTSAGNADHIVYSLQRPLKIDDFEGLIATGTDELAVTYSGIGMYYQEHVEKGQIVLDITVRPFFQKSKSWFKESARNTNVLKHEQTHFDITAIKACELAAAIRDTVYTRENYQKLPDMLYSIYSVETNTEQEAYDGETNHGILMDKQVMWEKKVQAKVRAIGCY